MPMLLVIGFGLFALGVAISFVATAFEWDRLLKVGSLMALGGLVTLLAGVATVLWRYPS